jgi:transcriptional regulator with XRE-family HTH domain
MLTTKYHAVHVSAPEIYDSSAGGELTVQISDQQGNNLGRIVKHARESKDFTQEQLAEQAGIGTRHLMAIENEGKHPSFELLYRLIRILDISPDTIFFPEGKPDDTHLDHLIGLLKQCTDRDVRVITALVKSMIANP